MTFKVNFAATLISADIMLRCSCRQACGMFDYLISSEL
jgi:hypothetical protein